MSTEINIETLEQLLSYEPETGTLTWKERPLELCSSEGLMKRFNTLFAGKEAGSTTNTHPELINGYYKRELYLLGKQYRAHRVAWALYHKEWPSDQIDHINGNALDNRIENLRVVTRFDNNKNRKKPSNNTSGFMGVHKHLNKSSFKWRAQIWDSNTRKLVHLGSFSNIEDAVAARAAAEIEHGYHENHGRELVDHDGH
jgi:hypothetical protein